MKNNYEIRGDTTAILFKRKDGTVLETLIDTTDLEKADTFPNTWFLKPDKQGLRPFGFIKGKTYYLYRWILDVGPEYDVDHINHNTLDNRRSNLRVVTRAKNLQNLTPRKRTSSPYRGVSYYKPNPKWKAAKWRAHITVNGKFISLGYFDDELEAAKVAAEARRRMMPYSND